MVGLSRERKRGILLSDKFREKADGVQGAESDKWSWRIDWRITPDGVPDPCRQKDRRQAEELHNETGRVRVFGEAGAVKQLRDTD